MVLFFQLTEVVSRSLPTPVVADWHMFCKEEKERRQWAVWASVTGVMLLIGDKTTEKQLQVREKVFQK